MDNVTLQIVGGAVAIVAAMFALLARQNRALSDRMLKGDGGAGEGPTLQGVYASITRLEAEIKRDRETLQIQLGKFAERITRSEERQVALAEKVDWHVKHGKGTDC